MDSALALFVINTRSAPLREVSFHGAVERCGRTAAGIPRRADVFVLRSIAHIFSALGPLGDETVIGSTEAFCGDKPATRPNA